jgi:hypothetical protein
MLATGPKMFQLEDCSVIPFLDEPRRGKAAAKPSIDHNINEVTQQAKRKARLRYVFISHSWKSAAENIRVSKQFLTIANCDCGVPCHCAFADRPALKNSEPKVWAQGN